MEDEEYDLSDSEGESPPRTFATSSSPEGEGEVARALAMLTASGSELESEHSEWFKVEPDDQIMPGKVDDSETEEDNDSDYSDLKELDAVESDGGEWLSIPQVKDEVKVVSSATMGTQSSQGFDDVRAPRVQDTIVGFASSPTFTNVQRTPHPGEAGNRRGEDGRRRQRDAIRPRHDIQAFVCSRPFPSSLCLNIESLHQVLLH